MTAFSGTRVTNLFNESFLNETEQDANSVLTELDKGLRSSKLGVQCEAIVRFPRLFEKYPFPILINSSFLKLSEFFWTGSNLLRFWVLRVCQQSENHLDKILNIDAFVKRIFMVMHANDPMARALTLRTLGAVSRVIPEKHQVHHAIRRALDSHDTIEVEAAIFASGHFAAQSRSFAISMCAKISDMIESLKIPLPMKLQLIPVLRHMHHDANTAALVKALCRKLLPKYPAESFVIAILDSLTHLSASTLTDIPDQIKLLLNALDDERGPVRCQALKSLTILADKQCVHAWPKTALGSLISKAQVHLNRREQFLFLRIILCLCDCPLTCHALLKEQQMDVLELCSNCMNCEDYETASQAVAILAALMGFAYAGKTDSNINYNVTGIMELLNIHMEGLIVCTIGQKELLDSLRRLLHSGIKLSTVDWQFGHSLVNILSDLLSDHLIHLPTVNESIACEALAAICSHFQMQKFETQPLPKPLNENTLAMDVDYSLRVMHPTAQSVPPLLQKLKKLEKKLTEDKHQITQHDLNVLESLITIIMISLMGLFMASPIADCIISCASRVNSWIRFRIARCASRFGQHYLSAQLYTRIERAVSVDKMRFYMRALAHMEEAECVLNHGVTYDVLEQHYEKCAARAHKPTAINMDNLAAIGVDGVPNMSLSVRLNKAVHLYRQALASMRASSSPMQAFTFQVQYLKLRAQFLQMLHNAVTIKNAHVTVPPPAIASSLAQSSRDYLQKFGHITNQLRKLVKSLKMCAESYVRLYKTSFDADPCTLEFLELADYQCALLAHVVERICYATPSDPPICMTNGAYPETRYIAACCQRMEDLAKELPLEPSNGKTIDNCHLNIITAEIELITRTPLCLPRYFYQQLQSTAIKLSVSPQPRNPGDAVLVQAGSNLVIKVEGVILHFGRRQEHFRQVESVQLALSQIAIPSRSTQSANIDFLKSNNDAVTLTQTVKPQRAFLSGSFLLPISSGGQWQVCLETYVIDENGNSWCTGPKNSMVVRVLDDPTKNNSTSSHASHSRHRF